MLFLDFIMVLFDIIKFIYQIKVNQKNDNRAGNTAVVINIYI